MPIVSITSAPLRAQSASDAIRVHPSEALSAISDFTEMVANLQNKLERTLHRLKNLFKTAIVFFSLQSTKKNISQGQIYSGKYTELAAKL